MTLFLVKVNDTKKFVEKRVAASSLSSWFDKVDLLDLVLEDDMTVRAMSKDEYNEILAISDEMDASK